MAENEGQLLWRPMPKMILINRGELRLCNVEICLIRKHSL